MLVDLFLALALEENLVRVAIILVEIDGCSNVKVVQKACNMEEYRVTSLCRKSAHKSTTFVCTYLCNAKELHCRPSSVEYAILNVDLLEDKILRHFIPVSRQFWPTPLLVLLCVLSLQCLHVLCHFL